MPSKVELKKEVDDLRASLKETTKRLTALEGEEVKHSSNPTCFPALLKIESDIVKGKSYWDIAEEQYNRWTRGENACLPCEREYVEAKESLMEIGERYRSLARPEDIKVKDIAVLVREQAARELEKAEAHIKMMAVSCEVKAPKVLARLLKMGPLAHVGRWGEFMDNQKQLIPDFELDIRESIPDIKVKIPSYAVAAPVKEIVKIVPKLTEEERKKLEETLTSEEKEQLRIARELAELPEMPKKIEILPPVEVRRPRPAVPEPVHPLRFIPGMD